MKTICIIGAGPSGITAAKNCKEHNLAFDFFEKNDKVGGNWVFNSKTGHSSVYENTHIISSKTMSEYEDYPMPEYYPDYPRHDQLQLYFENYAKYFGVYDQIKFNHQIMQVVKQTDGKWSVHYIDDQDQEHTKQYDYLMVANGHHWMPKYPEYSGKFTGKWMHSHDFKGVNDEWRNQKILVIGAGNSGCDVSVESARVSKNVYISMRSPQWFVPKFMFGQPADILVKALEKLPAKVRQSILTKTVKAFTGKYSDYGLPENTKPMLTQHPTANSDFIDYVRHGKIKPKPAIKRLNGRYVEFIDGSIEEFDIICCCTGFWTVFPFFDKDFLDFQYVEKIPLYKKMMHAEHDNLYFIGLFQPLGCIWPLSDYQAKLACQEIMGRYKRPENMTQAIQHEIEHPHHNFDGGQRHAVEVDYNDFRAELVAELKKVGIHIPERKPKLNLRQFIGTLLTA
nr:NAD(P)-binding domain-containing protein [Acinetobacter sp. Marseille-Q1620]